MNRQREVSSSSVVVDPATDLVIGEPDGRMIEDCASCGTVDESDIGGIGERREGEIEGADRVL